jgi:predicted Zn-dependent protease
VLSRLVPVVLLATSLASLLVSCDAPTASRPASAFDPTTLSNGRLYRWANGQRLRVWIVDEPVLGRDLRRAVRAAIGAWNAQPRFAEFELIVANSPSDANILVFDRSQPLPVLAGRCAFEARAAVGYTYFCGEGGRAERLALASGTSSSISVVIRIDRTLVVDQAGLDAIVAHEFGHALGIGAHSGDPADLMFGLPRVSIPSARDSRTLQFVLGSPPDLLL